MPKHQPKDLGKTPWRVPVAVEDVPEDGRRYILVADEPVRAAIARMSGLRGLPRLEAEFDVTRRGAGGLHVVGRVSTIVGQNCVVTLEPLDNEIGEDIDLIFMPSVTDSGQHDGDDAAPHPANSDDPEPLIDGVVDLGALATEFLILGLDPYPRKPGAVFESPQERERDGGPFAALSDWTKGGDAS